MQKYGPFYFFETQEIADDAVVLDEGLTKVFDLTEGAWLNPPLVKKARISRFLATKHDVAPLGQSPKQWAAFLSEDFLSRNHKSFEKIKITTKCDSLGRRLVGYVLSSPIGKIEWEKEGLVSVFGGFCGAKKSNEREVDGMVALNCEKENSLVFPSVGFSYGVHRCDAIEGRFYSDGKMVYAPAFEVLNGGGVVLGINIEQSFSIETEGQISKTLGDLNKEKKLVFLSEKNAEKFQKIQKIFQTKGGYVAYISNNYVGVGDNLLYKGEVFKYYSDLGGIHSVHEYKKNPSKTFCIYWDRIGFLKGAFSTQQDGLIEKPFDDPKIKQKILKSYFPRIWTKFEKEITYEEFLLEKSVVATHWHTDSPTERKKEYPTGFVPMALIEDLVKYNHSFYYTSYVDDQDYFQPVSFDDFINLVGAKRIMEHIPRKFQDLFRQIAIDESVRNKMVTSILLE